MLIDFLLAEDPPSKSPFPILATDENLHHHDPLDAIALHHIYRDPWERKIQLVKTNNGRDFSAQVIP